MDQPLIDKAAAAAPATAAALQHHQHQQQQKDQQRTAPPVAGHTPLRNESENDEPRRGLHESIRGPLTGDVHEKRTLASAANQQAFVHNAFLPSIETSIASLSSSSDHRATQQDRRSSAGLHLHTDLATSGRPMLHQTQIESTNLHPSMTSPSKASYALSSSLKSSSSMASSTMSTPGSALASPFLSAMADITPLPSPIVPDESHGAWGQARKGSQGSLRDESLDEAIVTADHPHALPIIPASPSRKKKGYGSLVAHAVETSVANNAAAAQENARNSEQRSSTHRSISDFVPETLQNIRQRHVTVGSGPVLHTESRECQMHREEYLAAERGLMSPSFTDAAKTLPSPPPSTASVAESDDVEEEKVALDEDGVPAEYLEVHCGINNRKRKFRQLRQLGQGTFSKVMLATNDRLPQRVSQDVESTLDPHKLVAVKIVQHGPSGGADEERIETSLKREVEMLKSVSHPSLIHLKACEYQPSRALLVLTYCPGGDLFDLASQKREVLTPTLIQRFFAELVGAVRYLHGHWIVHRDIKLENILVNINPERLQSLRDPISHPTPLVTLTDLGLSRRMPEPPESPLLQTRCGSEDYAAPEILLGQPYDGRQTDAWALGVLLYALMEGRLPFDAPPGKPDRSRNTHRIARCDWIWSRFGDEDGEWDSNIIGTRDFEGARLCVEALLKKVRMGRKPLEEVERMQWVQEGIRVPGGLRMREEDLDDEC